MTEERLDRAKLPVLVVEDDPAVRCLLQREIADLGHPVQTASSAEQALEQLACSTFAVVITDIRMPGMDGVELTQRIKDTSPRTEVILVTGFASVDSAARAVRLGASDYLTKPFGSLDRISESLDRALERHIEKRRTCDLVLQLEAHRDTLAHLVNQLPMGVLLIDGRGTVLLANSTAATILRQRDGLAQGPGGQLQITSQHAGPLRTLLDQATRPSPGTARCGGAVMLERPSGWSPFAVLVTPLGNTGQATDSDRPAAALFVSDPHHRLATAEELLCRLYGLTPTEARMAAILMQGRSVEDAARELAISTNTARTHLKRVFSKTGTARQGELISLLLSGPALLRLGRETA